MECNYRRNLAIRHPELLSLQAARAVFHLRPTLGFALLPSATPVTHTVRQSIKNVVLYYQ